MRSINYYPFVIVLLLLITACKKEQKQEASDMEQVTSWSKQSMEEFESNCVRILEKEGVSNAKKYCDCLLESSMESYPDAEVAMELEQHEIVQLFENSKCLDDILLIKLEDPWTAEVETLFVKHCLEAQLGQDVAEAEANAYCDCALEEIKKIVPNPHQVISLTEEELEQVLQKCKP